MAIAAMEKYRIARIQVWQWRDELSWVKKMGLSLSMACLIGLLAQIRMVIPGTPVPITGQTLGVLLAAVLLGRGWSGVSLLIYVGLGSAGIPWFNGFTGGIQSLAGLTGGYLIGFILAALFLGFVTDKYVRTRRIYTLWGLMLIADFVLVFGPGLLQLNLWLSLVKHNGVGLYALLNMGLFPYIIGDIIKVTAAAAAGALLMPKK